MIAISGVQITLPFTIDFDLIRKTLGSAQVGKVRVYNLSQHVRSQLVWNISNLGQPPLTMTLQAGYGTNVNNLPVIFQGNISEAFSVREGVNFITELACYDGGFSYANGFTNMEFPKGISRRNLISTLAASLPNSTLGAIGNYQGFTSRGGSYSGNTCDILTSLTGGGFFIDQGKANALQTNEYILSPSGTAIVNVNSGLLGTPVLEQNIVRFDMLFEPGLNIGHQIQLISNTAIGLNGLYTIIGVKHRGMISAAVCGSVVTTGEFRFDNLPIGVELTAS